MKTRFTLALLAVGVAVATTFVPAGPAQANPIAHEIWFGHSGKCLEPRSATEPKPLQQWECDGVSFQRWYFDYVGSDAQGIHFWRIRNASGGLCANNGGDNRAVLHQATCGASNWSDVWQLIPVAGSTYYFLLRNAQNRLCATLGWGDSGRANGVTIFQQTCGAHVQDPKQQYVGLS